MSDLEKLLNRHNLHKHYQLFKNYGINSISDFKKLYYTDLERVGVSDIKTKKQLYKLICLEKEKVGDQSFSTDVLLTNDVFLSFIHNNSNGMKEEHTENTSKLIGTKYEPKVGKEPSETTTEETLDLNKQKDVSVMNRNKNASSTSIEELNKSLYELRYGSKKEETTEKSLEHDRTQKKLILEDTLIDYTNLFYNSSNLGSRNSTIKDRPSVRTSTSCSNQNKNTGISKPTSNHYLEQLVKTVSQDSLQKIKPADGIMQRITVCVRKKPVNIGEKDVVECDENTINVREIKTNYDLTKKMHCHSFNFDHTYDENVKNEAVYEDLKFLIEHVQNGGNGSIIAYGQTGTGKTHTMLHPENGIVFLGLKDFLCKHESLYISFYEIYNGHLYDLLDYREKVLIRESNSTIYVQNITEHKIQTLEDGITLINDGLCIRRRGITGANNESSRSHAILKVSYNQSDPSHNGNCMLFVDLAGSERGNDRKNVDAYTKIEGSQINKSLLVLKECIRGISNSNQYLPFRQTKLTQVLKNAFLGDGKTCILATINPSGSCIEHTLNTLNYARRIKSMKPSSKYVVDSQHAANTKESLSKTVTELSGYFDRTVDNRRKVILNGVGADNAFSSSGNKDHSADSKHISSLIRNGVSEANLIILQNKKIESLSKAIVKQCSTTTDVKLLRKTIEWLRRVEAKINEMKFN